MSAVKRLISKFPDSGDVTLPPFSTMFLMLILLIFESLFKPLIKDLFPVDLQK